MNFDITVKTGNRSARSPGTVNMLLVGVIFWRTQPIRHCRRCLVPQLPDHVQIRRKDMFKGFTTSIIIITGLLLALPAVFVWSVSGKDWFEKLQQLTPLL